MEKESIQELRKRQETFFSDFSVLLKKPIKPESEAVIKARDLAEALKWKLRTLVHQVGKFEFLPDDIDVESVLNSYVEIPLIRFVEQLSKPWLRDKLTVAIMGHYSHGKTSLLNCLFNQNFPVQGSESTALSTYLSFGENTNIINLVDKGGSIQEILDTKNEVGLFDYKVSKNFPFARFFDYIQKECNNPLLQNLTIIDTPGLFTEKIGHSNPAVKVLYQADIILWCERLDRGFEETSLDFLQKDVVPMGKPIFLIGTFAENVRDVNDMLSHFVTKANDKGIELHGTLVYGENDTYQENLKQQFKTIASVWSNEFETNEPMVQVLYLVHLMIELLKASQKELKKLLTNLNSKSDELENSFKRAFNRFDNATSSFQTAYSNLARTFNNRCVNALACGGAKHEMVSRIESLRSAWNTSMAAYRDINFSDVYSMGHIGSKIAKVERDAKVVEELLQEFNGIYNNFVN